MKWDRRTANACLSYPSGCGVMGVIEELAGSNPVEGGLGRRARRIGT